MSLRIEHVLSAGNAAQAEAYIQRRGVIDVVFLDLNDSSIDHRELLRIAGELGNVRTLVVYSELQLELCRAAIQVKTLFDIKLLGVLDKPLQLTALQKLISRFVRSQIPPSASTWACSMIEHELIPEEQVRHGLVSGAFQAWYQPKFNLCDGQLFGAEVLVRWDHPVRGVLLPKDLLAAVLAYDLIDDMFKQLLDQGLLVLSRLRKQGVEIGLSFNLTASQLVHDDLVEHILHRLEQHRLSGTVLIFEVIENSLLNLPVPAYENLLRLYQAGCGLSIDDFGGDSLR
ncbi:diguanylate cyclase/phosphodiesterase [Pseudomonas chlororaphis subsp. aureofaciens]|nr:diguanylate cyclase/phosphodiesterase [Pseudomonas chlororaphis subsp. aureofaciens]